MGLFDDLTGLSRSLVSAAAGAAQNWADGSLEKAIVKRGALSPVPTEQKATEDPKSLFYDPFAIIEQLGFKDKPSQISYGTLRAIVWKVPIIHTVIQTRINQIAAFSVPQRNRYQMGFRLRLRDQEGKPTAADKKWIKQTEATILQTGVTDNPRGRDTFETFLRKLSWDMLVYDQLCAEIVPNRKGVPAEWYAVDAATIRLADTAKTYMDEDLTDAIRYVQIYDGMIVAEYDQDELFFGVRNPRSDIRLHGYGCCLHPDSRVKTTKGLLCVEGLCDQKFDIVIGKRVARARAYQTGTRRLFKTVFADGRVLKTSGDHRVWCLSEIGEFDWKKVRDLAPMDIVACDIDPLEGGQELPPFNHIGGRSESWCLDQIESDLWEVIGWLVGDGSFFRPKSSRLPPQYGQSISLFYNKEEEWICDRHRSILSKYGLPSPKYNREDGFEIKFQHVGFGKWLVDIAELFPTNVSGASLTIPRVLFSLFLPDRCSFLRGLFSADGCRSKHYDQPTLGCTHPTILADSQALLWSLGIRSRWASGWVTTEKWGHKGSWRTGLLYIYDKDRFFELIGFLHPHKQPILGVENYRGTRADVVGQSFARRCALRLREDKQEDSRVRGLLQTPPCWGVTRRWLEKRLPEVCPERDGLQWHHGIIKEVIDTGEDLEMYDVEVFDNFHGFVVDGTVVHNSELEMLVPVVTSLLWAWQYNSKFFSQGSAAKGMINIKGAIPDKQLKAFRRHWYQMLSGTENAWRTPITNAEDLQWINMQTSNRDMEYSAWFDFLIKICCAMYALDPVEINFKYGTTGQRSTMQEASNKEKITESKERGLRPLLRFLASFINQAIIWPIDENFEFEFVGLDAVTREEILEANSKAVKTTRTVDELRAEDDLPPLSDGRGDVILDPTWLQAQQQAAMAEQGGFGEEGEEDEGEVDFESLLGEKDEGKEEKEEGDGKEEKEKKSPFKKSLVVPRRRRYLVDINL